MNSNSSNERPMLEPHEVAEQWRLFDRGDVKQASRKNLMQRLCGDLAGLFRIPGKGRNRDRDQGVRRNNDRTCRCSCNCWEGAQQERLILAHSTKDGFFEPDGGLVQQTNLEAVSPTEGERAIAVRNHESSPVVVDPGAVTPRESTEIVPEDTSAAPGASAGGEGTTSSDPTSEQGRDALS